MLFMGRIADLYGRKLLYLLGLSIFVVFTIVSGAVRVGRADCCALMQLGVDSE
jgi:MFS family permease